MKFTENIGLPVISVLKTLTGYRPYVVDCLVKFVDKIDNHNARRTGNQSIDFWDFSENNLSVVDLRELYTTSSILRWQCYSTHLQTDIKTVRTNAAKAQVDFQESPSSELIMAQNFLTDVNNLLTDIETSKLPRLFFAVDWKIRKVGEILSDWDFLSHASLCAFVSYLTFHSTLFPCHSGGLDTVHVTNFVQSRHCRWQTDSFSTSVRVVSSIFFDFRRLTSDLWLYVLEKYVASRSS